jgi:post-GPI attachment to proteins factor 3
MIFQLVIGLLVLWCARLSLGSLGDIDPTYVKCRASCIVSDCKTGIVTNYKIPYGQILPLSCEEMCTYACIDGVAKDRESKNLKVVKFYGHWPFDRYFGLEEPASVFFSAFNAAPHILAIYRLWTNDRGTGTGSKQPEKRFYMDNWLLLYAIVSTSCWCASTIYHAKKTPFATKCDLISALGFIVAGLFIALRRICGTSINGGIASLLFCMLFVGWAYKAYFMAVYIINFDQHMKLSIGIVVLTTSLWLGWTLHQLLTGPKNGEYARVKVLCLCCQFGLIVASALEIFDFRPIYGIFDAHSLWHALTIPLGFVWYQFWNLERELYYKLVSDTAEHVSTQKRNSNDKKDK